MLKLQIKSIFVSQYEEATSDKMHSKVKGYIKNYRLLSKTESCITPRKYLWNVFNTLNQELL